MDYFNVLATKIKLKWVNASTRLKAYFKRLLFPIYLFPIKFITYTVFYLIKFLIKFILAFLGLVLDCIVFPFKSLKNFLKSIVIVLIAGYLILTFFVIADYLKRQYGGLEKTFCAFGYPANQKLQNSVVRIVGGYSEGSGFFISDNQVLTNFHVIADEPSPKIIFPDGKFVTPVKILGNKDVDLAVLTTEGKYENMIMPLPDQIGFYEEEPVISGGYALGTDLTGKATILKGRFVDFREAKRVEML